LAPDDRPELLLVVDQQCITRLGHQAGDRCAEAHARVDDIIARQPGRRDDA